MKCHLAKVEKIVEVVGEEETGVEVVIVEEVMDDLVEVGGEEDLVATEVIEATEAIEATEEIGEEVISVSPTLEKIVNMLTKSYKFSVNTYITKVFIEHHCKTFRFWRPTRAKS